MNCINCNKEIPNGMSVCPNCGTKTNSSSIILPTESEPRTMPSGGLNNNNIDICFFVIVSLIMMSSKISSAVFKLDCTSLLDFAISF